MKYGMWHVVHVWHEATTQPHTAHTNTHAYARTHTHTHIQRYTHNHMHTNKTTRETTILMLQQLDRWLIG